MRMVLAKLFWQYDLAWFNSDEIVWERDTKGYTLWYVLGRPISYSVECV
jgi:hypothetical protein